MNIANIDLRFVGYGCNFEADTSGNMRLKAPGRLPEEPSKDEEQAYEEDRRHLYANEIAVDVGGRCLNIEDEKLLILDHHFRLRTPTTIACKASIKVPESAAEAVLGPGRVAAIRERFASYSGHKVWIITHTDPDFDALCSVYLIHCCLTGDDLTAAWARKLAAYASSVDQCKTRPVARTEALHSVLYAAIKRKRNMYDLQVIVSFFDAARSRMIEGNLDPNFDAVFDESGPYAPELRLLRNEGEVYRRDLARARKSIVALQKAPSFDKWYADAQETPLLNDDDKKLSPEHPNPGLDEKFRLADGIFLRDPECLLFKEWARDDQENSRLGEGFTFTAIAYSKGKPDAKPNQTNYFFSLNPVRADDAHLYNVWTRLQQTEVSMLAQGNALPATGKENNARLGFEKRAGKKLARLFHDPWFDGGNYDCTIVVTPKGGTKISGPQGVLSDLSDDPVVKIVQEEVEYCVFAGDASLQDFGTADDKSNQSKQVPVKSAVGETLKAKCYRFVKVRLNERVPAGANPCLTEQVGRWIWPFLEARDVSTVPADFLDKHLIRMPAAVVVWNRRGIAVAYWGDDPETTKSIEELREGLEKTAEIARLVRELVEELNKNNLTLAHRQKTGQKVLQKLVELKLLAAMPEGLALRRFLNASSFHDVLDSIDALNEKLSDQQETERDHQQQQRDRDLQLILALGTALGLLFAWNQVESLGLTTLVGSWSPWLRFIAGLVLSALFFAGFALKCGWRTSDKQETQR